MKTARIRFGLKLRSLLALPADQIGRVKRRLISKSEMSSDLPAGFPEHELHESGALGQVLCDKTAALAQGFW